MGLRMWLLSARALWLFILVACALRVAIHCHVWRGLLLSSTACQHGALSTHNWHSKGQPWGAWPSARTPQDPQSIAKRHTKGHTMTKGTQRGKAPQGNPQNPQVELLDCKRAS